MRHGRVADRFCLARASPPCRRLLLPSRLAQYKLYYAQSLYKAGVYDGALRQCQSVDDPLLAPKCLLLQTAVRYEQDDLPGTRAVLEQCLPEDPDTIVNLACVLYKEGQPDEARQRFIEALNASGANAELAYNIALCFYNGKQYGPALKHIAEIIERGVREHPELSVGSQAEGLEVRSVGNSATLKKTALVEAFNLKAAIEFAMGNADAAREALADMPPRSEEELDPVTLHNSGLMAMDKDPTSGFRKLNFLIQNPPCPPETFQNLLLLYCKHGYHDLAADIMAENAELTFRFLSEELYAFIEATITVNTSPEQAFHQFDTLSSKHVDGLRKLTKQIQDARLAHDTEAIKECLKQYDDALERYVPCLMAQARIYWAREHYPMVEKIFRQSAEFCSGQRAAKPCCCCAARHSGAGRPRAAGRRLARSRARLTRARPVVSSVLARPSLSLSLPSSVPVSLFPSLFPSQSTRRGSSTWRTSSSCRTESSRRPSATTSPSSRSSSRACSPCPRLCWPTSASRTS